MKEHPALFKTDMVRALLREIDPKSQTRRMVKSDIEIAQISNVDDWAAGLAGNNCFGRVITAEDIQSKADKLRGKLHPFISTDGRKFALMCPYGQPGDRIWVKETFYAYGKWEKRFDPDKGRDAWYFVDATIGAGFKYLYAATENVATQWRSEGLVGWWKRPAIFMPRAASRILLEITGVRVQRLQEISEDDAISEGIERAEDFFGCPCWKCYGEDDDVVFPDDPVGSYRSLWESINGPGSWDANPAVWAISFKRLQP